MALVIAFEFSTSDFIELLEIIEVPRSARSLLEMPQVIQAYNVNGRAVGQYGIHAPPPRFTEIKRLLDKEIDLRARMVRAPERKDGVEGGLLFNAINQTLVEPTGTLGWLPADEGNQYYLRFQLQFGF